MRRQTAQVPATQCAGSESRQHHQLEHRSQCAVPVTGTSHAPVDVDSGDSESTSVEVIEEAVVHTSRQEMLTELSETSSKNRKTPFSLPSTSSGLHQSTDKQKQQLSAMFLSILHRQSALFWS